MTSGPDDTTADTDATTDTSAGGTDQLDRAAAQGQLPGTDDDAVDEGTTDSDRADTADDDAVASGVEEDNTALDGADERDFEPDRGGA